MTKNQIPGLSVAVVKEGKPHYNNRLVVSHNGSILGFASNITRFIDDGVTVILFCNLDQISRPDMIAKEIAGYYCPAIALY